MRRSLEFACLKSGTFFQLSNPGSRHSSYECLCCLLRSCNDCFAQDCYLGFTKSFCCFLRYGCNRSVGLYSLSFVVHWPFHLNEFPLIYAIHCESSLGVLSHTMSFTAARSFCSVRAAIPYDPFLCIQSRFWYFFPCNAYQRDAPSRNIWDRSVNSQMSQVGFGRVWLTC